MEGGAAGSKILSQNLVPKSRPKISSQNLVPTLRHFTSSYQVRWGHDLNRSTAVTTLISVILKFPFQNGRLSINIQMIQQANFTLLALSTALAKSQVCLFHLTSFIGKFSLELFLAKWWPLGLCNTCTFDLGCESDPTAKDLPSSRLQNWEKVADTHAQHTWVLSEQVSAHRRRRTLACSAAAASQYIPVLCSLKIRSAPTL